MGGNVKRDSLHRYIVTLLHRDNQSRFNRSRRLFRFGLRVERAFRLINNRLESRVVGESEIGKNFAIETDASGFQSFRKTAVGHAVGARGGIQSLDPKIAKGPFARFAVAIGPILAFHGRVLGVTEKFRPASAIAFGFFDDAFASGPAGRGVGGSWHLVSPGGWPDSSFSELLLHCRSFPPRPLI